MPRIKYAGCKADGERAFADKTGITWMPGSAHSVSVEHAALMLNHPDVWALDDEQPEKPGQTLADAPTLVAPAGNDLAGKTDDWLHVFAKANGLKVHHKLAGENLRAKMAEMLLAKQGEG